MAVVTTWWKREQRLASLPNLARPAAKRGAFGGQCFHVTCQTTGADWFNRLDHRYYCDECARRINEGCLAEGLTKVCELHL